MRISIRARIWVWLPLAALAVVFAGGCGRKTEGAATQPAPRPVTMITLRSTTTDVGAEVPGVVRPILEARIAPKIMSKVTAVLAREGDRVRSGQVLVRLENRDLAAGVAQSSAAVAAAQATAQQAHTALQMQQVSSNVDVRQAEAALRTAQANLAKVRQGPRPEQRQQAVQAVANARAGLDSARARLSMLREGARKQERAQAAGGVSRAAQAAEAAHQGVVAAEAALRTAQADYNRVKNLTAQGVVPQQQLDHATLRYESAQAQLAQARASERQAQAALDQAREQQSLVNEGPRTQEIAQAEQGVAQAEAGLKQAQLDLDMATRGGRPEDVVAAQAGVTHAEQALRNARAAQARDQLRESDVRVAQAAVGQAEAGRQSAGVMLGYSTLTAPFAGVVTARSVDPGSMATPGVPIIVVADNSEYRLEATVPEKLANFLHVGAPVKVQLDALQADWTASIVQMIPAADVASHSLLVKARLPRDKRLYSGLFGRLLLPTGQRRLILVPDKAVWREGSLTGVFVIADNKAQLRMVQLGAAHDGALEANSGLREGDVIAADATGLADGVPVQAAGTVQP
jgi:RND family efflux transporter MFP subunit